ncbi:helix-turn-helix domain-containing protein [Kribbella sp. NPDC003505]|uniref:helix-turn-helix domain-containing protein n=1 Tax=Kribbella sp. NPDC003505 TaxID=3154448 RepID=UPI0033B93C6A
MPLRRSGHWPSSTVSTSPSDAARKAQQALGLRLRELRKDAGLSGRELAVATGWHFTRVARLRTASRDRPTPTSAPGVRPAQLRTRSQTSSPRRAQSSRCTWSSNGGPAPA